MALDNSPSPYDFLHVTLSFLGIFIQILPHLRSKSWETRMAASLAIEHVTKNVPPWNPSSFPTENNVHPSLWEDEDQLNFQTFDIETVVKRGSSLLGSGGKVE